MRARGGNPRTCLLNPTAGGLVQVLVPSSLIILPILLLEMVVEADQDTGAAAGETTKLLLHFQEVFAA